MDKPRIGDRVTILDPDMEDRVDVPVIAMGNGEDFIIRTSDGKELAYNLAENITVTILDDRETAEEYHERTGEPWGAGEDCFERAMARAYPER